VQGGRGPAGLLGREEARPGWPGRVDIQSAFLCKTGRPGWFGLQTGPRESQNGGSDGRGPSRGCVEKTRQLPLRRMRFRGGRRPQHLE